MNQLLPSNSNLSGSSVKQKDLSLELLKCVATLLVINVHSYMMYPEQFAIFATGGTIGDALFMFCSGYTLFLGRMDRFDNWYKRRINRIYPSLFAWAIFTYFYAGYQLNMGQIITGADKWFVTCIMIYYVLLYFIRKYLMSVKWWIFATACIIPVIWFVLFEDKDCYHMYANHSFRFLYWFPFMLMGAFIGAKHIVLKPTTLWRDAALTVLFIGLHLGILLACTLSKSICPYQMLSLIPLIGVCIYMYKLCQGKLFKRLMVSKIGYIIQIIAGLCLESYIVQYILFTDKMNAIFSLNILIIMVAVLMLAYVVRTIGRIFKQIFEKEDFRWKEAFRLVNL